MVDKFTETTSKSWFDKIKDSFAGVAVGLALFLGSFGLLFWNENRAVRAMNSLNEGSGAVISVDSTHVDTANDGKLVHTTGQAETNDTLTDDYFPVSQVAIKLERNVEMYQWKENSKSTTQKKMGGGEETVTEYTYTKVWADSRYKSEDFKQPLDHVNPAFPYESKQFQAKNVTLGEYALPPELIGKISQFEPLNLTQNDWQKLSIEQQQTIKLDNGQFYRGQMPNSPQVGDIRIGYKVVKPLTVSVVAKQIAKSFEPYPTKAGDPLLMLTQGVHSAQNMFMDAQQSASNMTWLYRLAGVLAMFFGVSQILKPIAVLGDVVPVLGSVLGMGVSVVSFFVAVPLSLLTIGIAWMSVRPVQSIAMVILAVGAVVAFKVVGAKLKTRKIA